MQGADLRFRSPKEDEPFAQALPVHAEAEPALVNEGDVIPDLVQIGGQMGGEEDAPCAVLHQLLHVTGQLLPEERVQSGCRLIHDVQLRLVGEGEGQLEAGLLPAGEAPGLLLRVQSEPFAELQEQFVAVSGVGCAEEPAVGGEGHPLLKEKIIKDKADPVFGLPLHGAHGAAVHSDASGIHAVQVQERADEGCLAGPVPPDQSEDIAGFQCERDILQVQGADLFAEMADFK